MSSSDEPFHSRAVANECRSKCAAPGLGRTTLERRNALSTIIVTAPGVRKAQYGARQWINSVSALIRGRPFFR